MIMELILKPAEGSAGPSNPAGGCYMPLLKAFMDDNRFRSRRNTPNARAPRRLNGMLQDEIQANEISQSLSKER